MKKIILVAKVDKNRAIIENIIETKNNLDQERAIANEFLMAKNLIPEAELESYPQLIKTNQKDNKKNIICDFATYLKLFSQFPEFITDNEVIVYVPENAKENYQSSNVQENMLNVINEIVEETLEENNKLYRNKYQALNHFTDEAKYIFVIGSQFVYEDFINYASQLLISYSDSIAETNASCFPEIKENYWEVVDEKKRTKENQVRYHARDF